MVSVSAFSRVANFISQLSSFRVRKGPVTLWEEVRKGGGPGLGAAASARVCGQETVWQRSQASFQQLLFIPVEISQENTFTLLEHHPCLCKCIVSKIYSLVSGWHQKNNMLASLES